MRTLAVTLVVAAAAAVFAGPAGAARQPIVRLESAAVLPPRVSTRPFDVRIPVRLARRVARDDVRVRLLLVRPQDGQPVPGSAFKLAGTPAGGTGRGPALVVTIDPSLAGTGRYRLTIRAAYKGRRARLEPTIVLPAAELAPTAKVTIKRTVFIGGGDADGPTVMLEERSGRSAVTDLDARHTLDDQSRGITGKLTATPPEDGIAPGEAGEMTTEATGGFPVGSVEGTLRLDAPQLAAPVSVPFEVKTQLSLVWIPILLALGLAAGAGTRSLLGKQVAKNKARLEADDLVRRAEQEREAHPDETFRKAVDDAVAKVRDAEGDKAGDLLVKVKAQERLLDAALASLAERLAKERARFEARVGELGRVGTVPRPVVPALRAANVALQHAAALLERGDAAGAQEALDEVEKRVADEVLPEVAEWRQGAEKLVAKAQDSPFDMTPAADAMTNAEAALAAVPTAVAAPADAPAACATLPGAQAKRDAAATAIVDRVRETAEQVLAKTAQQRTTPDDVGRRRRLLARESTAAVTELARMAGEGRDSEAADQIGAVADKLRTLILDGATDAVQAAAETRLDLGDFAGAVDATLPQGQVAGAPGGAPAPTEQVTIAAPSPSSGAEVGAGGAIVLTQPAAVPLSRRARRRLEREVGTAEVITAIVAALVLVFVGYVLFAKDWVGTREQALAVFGWGYGSNLTAGYLATLLPQTQPQTSAGS